MDDFTPYGLFDRLSHTWHSFLNLHAQRRMHRQQLTLTRSFQMVEDRLLRQITNCQIDELNLQSKLAKAKTNNERTMMRHYRGKMKVIQIYTKKIETLLEAISTIKRQVTLAMCTSDITIALQEYVKAPYIYFSSEEVNQILINIERSALVTDQRIKDFENLTETIEQPSDIFQEEEEEEEAEEKEEEEEKELEPVPREKQQNIPIYV